MKNFTLLTILSFLSLLTFGQEATFNWQQDTISSGNNLQGMTITGDSTAVIIGFDNTFKKITEGQMKDIKAFDAMYDYIGLSSGQNTTVLTSRKSKLVDYPSSGKPDVYASGVMLKSNDMGNTWTLMDVSKIGTGDDASINPNAEGSYAKDIFAVGVYNNDTILAYSGWYDVSSGDSESRGAVFRTNDGGSTWEAITPDFGSKIITSIKVDDSLAYFGGYNKMYVTNLNTNALTDLYPNLTVGTDSNLYISSVTLKTAQELYVTTTSDGIFKTTDGGQTFTRIDDFGGGNDLCIINDSTLIVLGSSAKSMVSTDGGTTWAGCYPGKTCYSIGGVFQDTLYGMADTYAYKIAVSDLIGKNFNWVVSPELNDAGENLQKMAIYNENNALIIGYSEMCKTTNDGGMTWQTATLPADFNEDIEFDFTSISANGNDAYSTVRRFKIADFPSDSEVDDYYMEGLIISTTDNWESILTIDISKIGENDGDDATLNPQLDGCYGLNPYTIACVDANTAYVYANWYETITEGTAKSRGRVFKTTDAGATWSGITEDFGNSYINGIEFIGDLGFIAGSNVLYKTTDAGANLEDIYPNLTAVNDGDSSIFIKTIVLTDENTFYLPTTSDGVFYTSDGGATFTKLEGVDGCNDFYALDGNSFMLLGTTSKSYFTNDGGTTWQNPNVGKTVYSIGGVYQDTLYALGSGILYKVAVNDLDITTSSPLITNTNAIQLQYHSDHISVVSSKDYIESCYVYSISGKLVKIIKPNSNICQLNSYDYKPGIYIVAAMVKGQRFVDKIVFK
ncbi:hypothetical protein GM418_18285 [Maribellus comscasis]|uniref:T9SS C-terminal target domain-containing protein n=1 Tax=Maribellus comscasis TaxID=2681766 RepID=A0A6I6JW66_9BACT|nr:hypothetical protein [Maribellus comscasis]QGY45549.1 hypothetical protein GM418_18285 [Maribellus comscasis]